MNDTQWAVLWLEQEGIADSAIRTITTGTAAAAGMERASIHHKKMISLESTPGITSTAECMVSWPAECAVSWPADVDGEGLTGLRQPPDHM